MSVSDLLKKSYFAIRDEGIRGFIIKARNYLRKENSELTVLINNKNEDLTVSKILLHKFRNLQKIPFLTTDSNEQRINMVTDSLEKDSLFGGVATALIISTLWAKRRNCKLRIITRRAPSNPYAYNKILRVNEIDNLTEVDFYSDYDRDKDGNKNNALEVGQNEIFVATSWWTAYAIRKSFPSTKIIYILQEVETFFYPHGDEHSLCQSVMQDDNTFFVVNTKLLFDYFKYNESNVYMHGISFEPAFVNSLYKMAERKNEKEERKFKLFFYARPYNPRNLFYRGIDFLNKGINAGIIDTNKWDIISLGRDVPDITFDNGYKMVNKGILELDSYGDFLSDVDLTFSLMYTPHPSYPPYDALSSGSVVLTNRYANKKELDFSDNALLFDLNDKSFLDNLEKAIVLAEDYDKRIINFEKSKMNRSWTESLKGVMEYLEKQYD